MLASFPVQATIHFYNDESDPEEAEPEEEGQPSGRQCQDGEGPEENGPGGKCHAGQRPGGGLGAKGLLPDDDFPGGAQCSSSQ